MEMKLCKSNIDCFLLCLIPLCIFFSNDGSFSVQSIIIPIGLLFLSFLTYRSQPQKSLTLKGIVLICISIIVSLLSNILFHPDLLSNLYLIRIFYTILVLVFYYCASMCRLNQNQIKKIFFSIILIGVVISLYFLFVESIWYHNLSGTRFDKNYVAAFISLAILISFYFFLNSTTKLEKILFLFSFSITVCGVFLSACRSSMLLSLIGIFLILLNNFFERKTKTQIILFLIAGILFFVVIIMLLPDINNYMLTSDYAWFWKRYFLNSYQDSSNYHRLALWKLGIETWLDRPLFGYGPGAKNLSSTIVAHNTFLDYLVDCGIIGLFGFLLIWFDATRKILFNRDNPYKFIPITVFLTVFILPAERSVFLWFSLIMCKLISDTDITRLRKQKG